MFKFTEYTKPINKLSLDNFKTKDTSNSKKHIPIINIWLRNKKLFLIYNSAYIKLYSNQDFNEI